MVSGEMNLYDAFRMFQWTLKGLTRPRPLRLPMMIRQGFFSVKNLQRRTVDGPNPSPPGMVKTLKTMG